MIKDNEYDYYKILECLQDTRDLIESINKKLRDINTKLEETEIT